MKRIMVLLTMALLLPVFAWGSCDFNKGMAAYNRKDYHNAIKEWKTCADEGDAKAQYNLGMIYQDGQGVQQDVVKAGKWIGKAAKQGNATAQKNLDIVCRQSPWACR